MFRHLLHPLVPLVALAALAACADRDLPTVPPPQAGVPDGAAQAATPRERLAARLAVALGDPATRTELYGRLQRSTAPEGKVQFQALARLDGNRLLAQLASTNAVSLAELLADLDAARGLELYLPVESHRAAWQGTGDFLVGTLERDGDAPVAFDADGNRSILHPLRPPATAVIALVPQEFDFTNGQPLRAATCWTLCDDGGGGGGSGGGGNILPSEPGAIFMIQSHFEGDFEGWLKGKPEYEYHLFGQGADGNSIQLACVGEHAGAPYAWDQNSADWTGAVPLLTASDRAAYEQSQPGGVVRILAWEDDDGACKVRHDANRLDNLVRTVDSAYQLWTSGKPDLTLSTGLQKAKSVFDLLSAAASFFTTGDDFIGNAVEASIAGSAPGGANWLLKTDGTRTTGWFTTQLRP